MASIPWGDESAAPKDVQVLDLATTVDAVNSGDQARKEKALCQLKGACSVGFVYVKNHGIPPTEVDDLVTITRATIQQLTKEQRKELAATPERGLQGLVELGGESSARVLKVGDYVDYCTKFSWKAKGNASPNTAFAQKYDAYYAKVRKLASTLLNLLGEALGLDATVLRALNEGKGLLRVLDYPDLPADRCTDAPRQMRMAPHQDFDIITVLYQQPSANGVASLQAHFDGEWVDIPAIKDTFVVNFGEVLTALTNDTIPATYHRVVCPGADQHVGSARASVPFFFEPQPDFMVPISRATRFKAAMPEGTTELRFADFIQHLMQGIHQGDSTCDPSTAQPNQGDRQA